MYSPWAAAFNVKRNAAYDGKESIVTLDQFLSFAKNNSVGVYLDVQVRYPVSCSTLCKCVEGRVHRVINFGLNLVTDCEIL